LVFVGGSYWFSDKLAVRAAGAVPVSEAEAPKLYAIVRDLTSRLGIPMPAIYISPAEQPNAFATGRNPSHAAVAVTQGLFQVVDEDEMRGVLAHEISHVANRDILITSVAAAAAMGITFVARMAMWGAMFGGMGGGDDRDRGGNIFGMLAMMILAPIAALMLQMALSRSREFEADHDGAELLGNGEPLARALEKIEAYPRMRPRTSSTRSRVGRSASPACSRPTRPRPSASPASVTSTERTGRLRAVDDDRGRAAGNREPAARPRPRGRGDTRARGWIDAARRCRPRGVHALGGRRRLAVHARCSIDNPPP
jgi:heat shock protein HtpX